MQDVRRSVEWGGGLADLGKHRRSELLCRPDVNSNNGGEKEKEKECLSCGQIGRAIKAKNANRGERERTVPDCGKNGRKWANVEREKVELVASEHPMFIALCVGVCVLVLTGQHLGVGAVRDGEEMGRHFSATTATVHLHYSVGVDGEALVGVDYHAEQTRVGLQVR